MFTLFPLELNSHKREAEKDVYLQFISRVGVSKRGVRAVRAKLEGRW